MRSATVQTGLRTVAAGMIVVLLATFCHEWLAETLSLSHANGVRLIVSSLFTGGILGGFGVVITVIGLFSAPRGREVRLLPVLVFLVATVVIFWILFCRSVDKPRPQRSDPAGAITI